MIDWALKLQQKNISNDIAAVVMNKMKLACTMKNPSYAAVAKSSASEIICRVNDRTDEGIIIHSKDTHTKKAEENIEKSIKNIQ